MLTFNHQKLKKKRIQKCQRPKSDRNACITRCADINETMVTIKVHAGYVLHDGCSNIWPLIWPSLPRYWTNVATVTSPSVLNPFRREDKLFEFWICVSFRVLFGLWKFKVHFQWKPKGVSWPLQAADDCTSFLGRRGLWCPHRKLWLQNQFLYQEDCKQPSKSM